MAYLPESTFTLFVQVLPPGMAPGNAGYDPSSIHCVALKTLMANFERIGAGASRAPGLGLLKYQLGDKELDT